MQSKHIAVLNTATRVQQFLLANAAVLGPVMQSSYRATIDDVVDTLASHSVSQTSSRRAGAAETARLRVLRNALRLNHMRPIAAIAMAQLRQVPEFAALRMPSANSTSRGLIAAAGAMGAAATEHVTTFTDGGLPTNFVGHLQAAADALNASLTNRGVTGTAQSGATAGLASEATRARQAVKVLDSLVEPQLAGNVALLAQWKTAKRFGGRVAPISSTTVDAASRRNAPAPAPSSAAGSTTPPVPAPAVPAAAQVPVAA